MNNMPQRPPKSADEIRDEIAALQRALTEAEEAERKASMAAYAIRSTALLTAMREAHKEIEAMFPGTFEGETWGAIKPQSWPRDTKFKRAADLSETQIHEARELGRQVVAGTK